MPLPTFAFTPDQLQVSPKPSQPSNLDIILNSSWHHHLASDHFRYPIHEPPRPRVLPGKFGFLLQLIPERSTNRRPPQVMQHLSQPFDPNAFNFCLVDEDREGVCTLLEEKNEEKSKHLILINTSPAAVPHCLLTPNINSRLPQVCTVSSVRLALKCVLSAGVDTRASFNSLCANASVNHLHWHLYRLEGRLPLETSPVKHLTGRCFVTREHPAAAFAFQLEDPGEVEEVAVDVVRLTDLLWSRGEAHNAYITRGVNFKQEGEVKNVARVFVWARKKADRGDGGEVVMASWELAGHVLCYDKGQYENWGEEEVEGAQREACAAAMERNVGAVRDLFSEDTVNYCHVQRNAMSD